MATTHPNFHSVVTTDAQKESIRFMINAKTDKSVITLKKFPEKIISLMF